MNKKLLFTIAAATVLSSATVTAQSVQSWKVGGNALTATGKFGSTSNFPVDFITNNVKRMTLTNTGNLRFNSDQSSIQFPNPGSSPKPMMFIYESGSINTSRMLFAYSPGFPTFGLQYNPGDKMDFIGGGISVLDVDLASKRVGVGTTAPLSKLHVKIGSSGAPVNPNSLLTLENSTSNFLNLLTPNANESGILFGNPASSADGGIVYNSPSIPKGLNFRTNGNVTRMVLTANGRLGIGTTTPNARLDLGDLGNEEGLIVRSGNNPAIDVETNSNVATITTRNNSGGDGVFALSNLGQGIIAVTNNPDAFAGFFTGDVFTSGTYQSFSDEKLKQNIRDFSSAMNIINELHPKLYQYKKEGNFTFMQLPKGDHYGLIAQDVEKVLPNLVKDAKFDTRLTRPDAQREKSSPSDVINFKALNYTELIPVMIKAMQELSKQNEDLQKQVDELKAIVVKGSQQSAMGNQQSAASPAISSAFLDQNTPNPFINSTTIRYNIPQQFSAAQIMITDNNGKQIKQVRISNSGKGSVNVDASALINGTYNYSLVIDGKLIDSKQMILIK